jgi:hypothetical protein
MFLNGFNQNKPVGDRDHEVLGMGSFGEYTHTGIKYAYHQLQGLNTDIVLFWNLKYQLKKRKGLP